MSEPRKPQLITRTAENGKLDELPGVGEHKPQWAAYPEVLICSACSDLWPCPPVQAVIDEVESLADGLCCGGVLWRRAKQLRGVA